MSWLFLLLLPVVTLSKRQNTNAKQVPDVHMRTQGYTVCVCVLDRCIKRPRSKQLDSSQLLATSLVERDAVFEC